MNLSEYAARDGLGLAELVAAAAARQAGALVGHARARLHAVFALGEIFLAAGLARDLGRRRRTGGERHGGNRQDKQAGPAADQP